MHAYETLMLIRTNMKKNPPQEEENHHRAYGMHYF